MGVVVTIAVVGLVVVVVALAKHRKPTPAPAPPVPSIERIKQQARVSMPWITKKLTEKIPDDEMDAAGDHVMRAPVEDTAPMHGMEFILRRICGADRDTSAKYAFYIWHLANTPRHPEHEQAKAALWYVNAWIEADFLRELFQRELVETYENAERER